jgi:hypothetical protein
VVEPRSEGFLVLWGRSDHLVSEPIALAHEDTQVFSDPRDGRIECLPDGGQTLPRHEPTAHVRVKLILERRQVFTDFIFREITTEETFDKALVF